MSHGQRSRSGEVVGHLSQAKTKSRAKRSSTWHVAVGRVLSTLVQVEADFVIEGKDVVRKTLVAVRFYSLLDKNVRG